MGITEHRALFTRTHQWFICPFADQTPVLLDAFCYPGDAGSVTSSSLNVRGPVIEDVNMNHSCVVVTIILECQNPILV